VTLFFKERHKLFVLKAKVMSASHEVTDHFPLILFIFEPVYKIDLWGIKITTTVIKLVQPYVVLIVGPYN